jgi:hypothetical protein
MRDVLGALWAGREAIDPPVANALARYTKLFWINSGPYEHITSRKFALEITGEQLFRHVEALAEQDGWEFGGAHAGHLVGQFPHETIDGAQIESYIAPGSTQPMRRLDRSGRQCHWILEIHLVDRERQFGGFHEELLDLGP